MEQDMERRRTVLFLSLLTLIALAVRFFRIGAESFWLDEAYSLYLSSSDGLSVLTGSVGNRHTPPFYYYLLHLWLAFGDSEAALRSLSAILGAISVPLVYAVGRPLVGRRPALIGAAAAVLSPFLVYYGQEARGYTFLLLLVLLSTLFLWRFVSEGRLRDGVLFALVSILALYTHYYAGFMLVASNLFAVWELRRNGPLLRRWIILQIVIGLAFLPWMINLVDAGFGRGQIFRRFLFTQIPYSFLRFNVGYGLLPLTGGAKTDPGRFVLGNLLLIGTVFLVYGALLIRGIARVARRGRAARFLLIHLAAPFALALLVSLRSNLISERYLIVAFPFFLLLVAAGTDGGRRLVRLTAAAAAVLLLAGLWGHFFNPRAGKAEWREAAAVVTDHEKLGDGIFVAPTFIELPFRYYYRGDAPILGLQRSEEFDRARFDEAIARLGGVERFWLVIAHTEHRDFYLDLIGGEARQVEKRIFTKENGIIVALFERTSSATENDGTAPADAGGPPRIGENE